MCDWCAAARKSRDVPRSAQGCMGASVTRRRAQTPCRCCKAAAITISEEIGCVAGGIHWSGLVEEAVVYCLCHASETVAPTQPRAKCRL